MGIVGQGVYILIVGEARSKHLTASGHLHVAVFLALVKLIKVKGKRVVVVLGYRQFIGRLVGWARISGTVKAVLLSVNHFEFSFALVSQSNAEFKRSWEENEIN